MIEIDRQDLAEMAAVAFRGDDRDDIPEKLWVDQYGETVFVRAAWSSGITARRTTHLEELRDLVAAAYRVEAVAVAYWQDLEWDEIDAHAHALQGVR
jgi:hypothetical protein